MRFGDKSRALRRWTGHKQDEHRFLAYLSVDSHFTTGLVWQSYLRRGEDKTFHREGPVIYFLLPDSLHDKHSTSWTRGDVKNVSLCVVRPRQVVRYVRHPRPLGTRNVGHFGFLILSSPYRRMPPIQTCNSRSYPIGVKEDENKLTLDGLVGVSSFSTMSLLGGCEIELLSEVANVIDNVPFRSIDRG